MFGRLSLSVVGLLAGIALATFIPALPQWLRTIAALHSISAEQNREPSFEENRERTEPRDEQQARSG